MPTRTCKQSALRFPVKKNRTRSSAKKKPEKSSNGKTKVKEVKIVLEKVKSQNIKKSPIKSPNIKKSPIKYLNIKKSPIKSSNIRNSPIKSLNIQKSPEKVKNGANENGSSVKLNGCRRILDSPRKSLRSSPLKANICRQILTSPSKTISNKLQLTPIKSLKPTLDLDSPVRRSPRKLEFTNSPSTLISKLAVSSPLKKSFSSIGLHKPDLRVYRSLKTSLACNSSNHIIGRETEIETLQKFLGKHLKENCSGSLYISGAPGTGKTASVTKIVNDIKDVKFKYVFLNCMSAKTSKEIFSAIAKSLNLPFGRTEREVLQYIENFITSSKIPILIILDEVDQLESKNQDVLYTIFEWPSLADSKAVLIGIANMLDLTDRILPRLQANRSCRPQLLHFPAYTKAEIVKIINERIKEANIGDVEVIKQSAIHFLAAKVASVAGDVRKALDVCRRAVELSEVAAKRQARLVTKSPSKSPRKLASEMKKVEIPQVLSIFNEVYGSRVAKEFSENPHSFPLQQKVLICTLLLMMNHCKTKNVTLGKFHEVYTKVCSRQKLPPVEQSEFFSLCTLLESRGMLQVKKSKELRNSKILLRLDEDEAKMALGDKNLLCSILEDKGSVLKPNRLK